ncbi:MAG: D-alanine--D-alanine ligase [Myxococcales bacterium]|nr:D-alanine--D-alanine ligase [Myxococcales bacterium]MBL0198225.1 D-alanine--D-alanine ligase [Myxococcales bacterium]HQY64481.1 hypothetical protein [Polyangiaceae bacterium]
MRIAVLANVKPNAPAGASAAPDAWAELDSPATVEAIARALQLAGHEVASFEGDLGLVEALPRFGPDLCFNLCEGHFGESRESHVPALLEMLRIPYTGAGVLALAVSLDKPTTKTLLRAHGVRTPPSQVFSREDEALDPDLAFPLFVKPSREGSGIGVTRSSLVRDEAALRVEVARVLRAYAQPALVERFVRGRELTVGLVGNLATPTARLAGRAWRGLARAGGLYVLPVYEIAPEGLLASGGVAYTGQIKTQNWDDRWQRGRHYHCPAPLPPATEREVVELAAATFRATGCRDFARVDVRLDEAHGDVPYVLEINPLPGLAPGVADLCFQAAAAGLPYDELVLGVLAQAVARLGLGDSRARAKRTPPERLRARARG